MLTSMADAPVSRGHEQVASSGPIVGPGPGCCTHLPETPDEPTGLPTGFPRRVAMFEAKERATLGPVLRRPERRFLLVPGKMSRTRTPEVCSMRHTHVLGIETIRHRQCRASNGLGIHLQYRQLGPRRGRCR